MRTLKKSLSLVLALVLVLGLCVIGSNASAAQYTDEDKVQYEDAVYVLTGLSVIEGYPDGSFNPTANVTRAEAAAMITRMMLGRENADKLPVGDVKFSDVPETNWAAKYIAFCANKGIIVGMGDGTFHPGENVTGTQMAAMLLRALGYGVVGEYEGKGWDINAVADALYFHVFDDSKVTDFSKAATREETALYVWNTLFIQLVGYDVDLNYYTGREILVKDELDNNVWVEENFANDCFDLLRIRYRQVLANKATGSEYTEVGYLGTDANGQLTWYYRNLDMETGLDLIGHEVTIYIKATEKEDKINHVDYYETYLIKDESTVVSPLTDYVSYDDLYRVLKAANKNNVNRRFNTILRWTNYDCRTIKTINPADYDVSYIPADQIPYLTIGDLKGQKSTMDQLAWIFASYTWILDHTGEVLLVLDTARDLGKVKLVDTAHEEIEVKVWLGDHYDADVFPLSFKDLDLVYDGIAKDDYVVVQPVGELTYFYPTSTETAEITSIEQGKFFGAYYDSYTFNGTYSKDSDYGIPIDDQDEPEFVGVGDVVKFYVVKGAFSTTYFGLEIVEKAGSAGYVYLNYATVIPEHGEWEHHTNVIKLQCIDQNGEEVIYKMTVAAYNQAGLGGLTADGAEPLAINFDEVNVGVYAAKKRSNGYVVLTEPDDVQVDFVKRAGINSFLRGADGIAYYVTSDTKVIYFTGVADDLDITLGKTLKEKVDEATDTLIDYQVYAISKRSGGTWKLDVVWVNEPAEIEYESIMFIKADDYSNVRLADGKDKTGYYFTVYIDGVKKEKVHLANESYAEGFYEYKYNEKRDTYTITPRDWEVTGAWVTNDHVKYDKGDDSYKLYGDGFYRMGWTIDANGNYVPYFYFEGGWNFDAVDLTACKVVDISAGCAYSTTRGTKTDAAVNSFERMVELLSEGYVLKINFTFTWVVDQKDKKLTMIPTGVIYVTGIYTGLADD